MTYVAEFFQKPGKSIDLSNPPANDDFNELISEVADRCMADQIVAIVFERTPRARLICGMIDTSGNFCAHPCFRGAKDRGAA